MIHSVLVARIHQEKCPDTRTHASVFPGVTVAVVTSPKVILMERS